MTYRNGIGNAIYYVRMDVFLSSFRMNLIKKRGLLSRGGEETVLNRDSKGTRKQLTIEKVVWKLV